MRRGLIALAVLGLALASCGSSAAPSSSAAPGSTEVSGTVPPGPALVFEDVEIEEGFVAAVPVGWVEGELPGKFQPPADAGFDPYQLPTYWVSRQCAGACAARSATEWAATVEQSLFSSYRRPEMFDVVRDEVGEDHALLETVNVGERTWTDLQIARWADGHEKIITCLITLHEDDIDLLGQFEDACMSIPMSVRSS